MATQMSHPPCRIATPVGDFIPRVLDDLLSTADLAIGARNPAYGPQIESGFISLGLKPIDALLGRLSPGSLICLASRPSVGKTLLLLQIARHITLNLRQPAILISPINRARMVVQRLVCAEASLTPFGVRPGWLDSEGRERLLASYERLVSAPLLIADQALPDILELDFTLSSLARSFEMTPVILIDDLGPGIGRDWRRRPDATESASLVQALHAVTRNHRATVILTLGLDRGVESRADHRPELKDLKWVQGLIDECNATLILHRPEIYFPDAAKGRIEIEVCAIGSPTGPQPSLCFDAALQRITAD